MASGTRRERTEDRQEAWQEAADARLSLDEALHQLRVCRREHLLLRRSASQRRVPRERWPAMRALSLLDEATERAIGVLETAKAAAPSRSGPAYRLITSAMNTLQRGRRKAAAMTASKP